MKGNQVEIKERGSTRPKFGSLNKANKMNKSPEDDKTTGAKVTLPCRDEKQRTMYTMAWKYHRQTYDNHVEKN